MPRRCPDVSSPHLDRGRDLRCCALGKTDAGCGWLRVQLGQPGVLLLRHSLGGSRGVAVAMFGPSGLDMLNCQCKGILRAHAYALGSIFSRGLASGLCFGEECRGAVPRPERNQIEGLERELAVLCGPQRRATASLAVSSDVCRDEPAGGVPGDVAGGADDRWARSVHRAYPLLAREPSFWAAATASGPTLEFPDRVPESSGHILGAAVESGCPQQALAARPVTGSMLVIDLVHVRARG